MIVKLLTEHHLAFLRLKGGCRGSSESTYVKMPHCLEITCTGLFILSALTLNHDINSVLLKRKTMSENAFITDVHQRA